MKTKLTSLAFILLMVMALAALAQAAPAGKITNLEGRADLTAAGQPAKASFIGQDVHVGDIIRTKSASKCEVTWVDGSIARLAENSRLKITEFSLQKTSRKTILSLFRGKVQNIVTASTKLFGSKGESQYEVHTPTSVCGVRGTIFFSSYENGVAGSLFSEGSGYMYSLGRPGERKTINPGVWMFVTSRNTPPGSRPATPGEMDKFFQDTNLPDKKKDSKKSNDEQGTAGADAGGTTGGAILGGDPASSTGGTPEIGGGAGTLVSTNPAGPIVEQTPVVPVNPSKPADVIETVSTGVISAEWLSDGKLIERKNLTKGVSETIVSGTADNLPSVWGSLQPNLGGSTGGGQYSGYFAGAPGSWEGLTSSIYVTGTGAGYLYGALNGTYDASTGAFSGTGPLQTKTGILGDTAILPGALENEMTAYAYALPVIGSINVGGMVDPLSASYTEGISGIPVTYDGRARILAVWNVTTQEGTFQNNQALETWKTYYSRAGDDNSYYMFGVVSGTDDLLGHVTVNGMLDYLDGEYIGKIDLDYRGYYNGNAYQSAGAGRFTLDKLAFAGSVAYEGGAFMYTRYVDGLPTHGWDESSKMRGLLGSTSLPWGDAHTFVGRGSYENPNNRRLWWVDTPSDNGLATTSDGGALLGDMLGVNYGDNKGQGIYAALFVRPEGKAGYIAYHLTSDFYPGMASGQDAGAWSMHAERYAFYEQSLTGVAPEDLTWESGKLTDRQFVGLAAGDVVLDNFTSWKTSLMDEHWGFWSTTMANGVTTLPGAGWKAKAGGISGYWQGDSWMQDGYWLADLTGDAWAEGKVKGGIAYRYLTLTTMGAFGDALFGAYELNGDTGLYDWQAASAGVYGGKDNPSWEKPLAFSNKVEAIISTPEKLITGNFEEPGQENLCGYYYYQVVGNRAGEVEYRGYTRNDAGEITGGTGYNIFYGQNGIQETTPYTYIYDAETGEWSWVSGAKAQEPWSGDLAALISEGQPSDFKGSTRESVISFPDGQFAGLMGGLSLKNATAANPADTQMIGAYQEGVKPYRMWGADIVSQHPSDGTTATPEGWAYQGYLGGVDLPSSVDGQRSLSGKFLSLYVDPSGNIGYLKGALAGEAYPAIGMAAMAGGLYPEPVALDAGIDPANIGQFIWSENGLLAGLKGTFNGTGNIATSNRMMPFLGYDQAVISESRGMYYDFNTMGFADDAQKIAQPWGIYRFTAVGFYDNPEAMDAWSGRTGGRGVFGVYYGNEDQERYFDDGIWLAGIDQGQWNGDHTVSGVLKGVFLTGRNMGTMSGDVLGVWDANGKVWQAGSLGVWKSAPLSFFSNMDAFIAHATKEYDGRVNYYSGETQTGYYEYHYYADNSHGSSYEQPTDNPDYYISTSYSSDGTKFTEVCDGTACFSSSGVWDTSKGLAFLKTPAPPPGKTARVDYAYDNITLNPSGVMFGGLGGVNSLWTGNDIPVTALGTFINRGDSIWHTMGNTFSYNYLNDTYTTYDGGAFVGMMGGSEVNNRLEGQFLGIYIAPDKSAGYLQGSVSGDLYPAISMFKMEGVLNRTHPSVAHDPGVAPENLYDSIWNGDLEGRLAGRFADGGIINNNSGNGGSGALAMVDSYYSGATMSIVNRETNAAQNWGIYGMALYGGFTNPSTASWTAHAGGNGFFGAYIFTDETGSGNLIGDEGFWLAAIGSGGLADTGKLSGVLDGKFLTQTKLGSLKGDLRGSLNSNQNVWDIFTMGVWEGRDLKFVSSVEPSFTSTAVNRSGFKEYGDGGTYSYSYLTDNYSCDYDNPGYVSYRRYGNLNSGYDLSYLADGTTEKINYTYNAEEQTWSETGREYGAWDQSKALSCLETDPEGAPVPPAEAYPYTIYNWDGTNGLLGGTDSLWTATAASPAGVTYLGNFYPAGYENGIDLKNIRNNQSLLWGAVIESNNFRDGSLTTYDGGSYTGIMHGVAIPQAGTDGEYRMNGQFLSLYIDPDGRGGYLRGGLTGTAYSSINMIEMTGSIYPEQKTVAGDPLLDPRRINDHVWKSTIYSNDEGVRAYGGSVCQETALAGDFGGQGWIRSSGYDSSGLMTMGLIDYEKSWAAAWGIYGFSTVGLYNKPEGSGNAWNAVAGGTGVFGAYNVANSHSGGYSYDSLGSYYNYNYFSDNRSGSREYRRFETDPAGAITGGKGYDESYNADGTLLVSLYSYNTGSGSWEQTAQAVTPWNKSQFNVSRLATPEPGYKAGGETDVSGTRSEDNGFWLATANGSVGDANSLSGTLSGKFITYTKMGSLSGNLFGALEQPDMGNSWQALSSGVWEGAPLAFFSETYPGMWSYTDGSWQYEDNLFVNAFLGGVDSLWTADPVNFSMLGQWQTAGALISKQHVFSDSLYSYNDQNGANTTFDNGAYFLYSGGNELNGKLDGMVGGLYYDPAGHVGIIYGNFTGINYPEIGIWSGTGVINGHYQLGEGGGNLNANNFLDAGKLILQEYYFPYGSGDVIVAGDAVTLRELNGSNAWINGEYLSAGSGYWGAFQNLMGGSYDKAKSPSPAAWTWEADIPGMRTDFMNIQVLSSADGVATGELAGATAIYTSGVTFVNAANLKGLFDPVSSTFQTIAQGTFMETGAFINLVNSLSDAEKNAFMAAMKIPAINVGQATLTQGAGVVNNLSNVTMNNVTFFATSTGAVPKIWATNDVRGNYAAAPSLTGPAVNLSGNGLNATFNVNYWDGANWGARVAGSGNLSGGSYAGPVDFKGAAAGAIKPEAGSFSGTGAGIALQGKAR
jgi:hypothetical protein